MLLSERPDLPAAKHHCEQALEHKPDHAKAHHLMGNILASQRDASAATDAYKRAEALSSDASSSAAASPALHRWDGVEIGHTRTLVLPGGRRLTMETLALRPLAFLVRGFLDASECDALIGLARPKLKASLVMGDTTAAERTSSSVFLPAASDPLLGALQERLAALAQLPLALVQTSEDIQVVHYDGAKRQTFGMHHDSSSFQPRLLTAFYYLNEVEEGGQTVFPAADGAMDAAEAMALAEPAAAGKAPRGHAGTRRRAAVLQSTTRTARASPPPSTRARACSRARSGAPTTGYEGRSRIFTSHITLVATPHRTALQLGDLARRRRRQRIGDELRRSTRLRRVRRQRLRGDVRAERGDLLLLRRPHQLEARRQWIVSFTADSGSPSIPESWAARAASWRYICTSASSALARDAASASARSAPARVAPRASRARAARAGRTAARQRARARHVEGTSRTRWLRARGARRAGDGRLGDRHGDGFSRGARERGAVRRGATVLQPFPLVPFAQSDEEDLAANVASRYSAPGAGRRPTRPRAGASGIFSSRRGGRASRWAQFSARVLARCGPARLSAPRQLRRWPPHASAPAAEATLRAYRDAKSTYEREKRRCS